METLTFEFDDDEMRLIEEYKQAVGAVDIRAALLNAVSVAIDRVAWDHAFVKRGHWDMKPDPYGFFDEIPVCSKCGLTTKMRETYNFCPNCGADMREE